MTTLFITKTMIENDIFDMVLIKTDTTSADVTSVNVDVDYETLTVEEKATVDAFKALMESKA